MDPVDPTFDEFFEAEYPSIVAVVARIAGSKSEAEAVVQDAFVKALVGWRRISRYDRPGAWVQRVAIRDALRNAGRDRSLWIPPAAADPADEVSARTDLWTAIGSLSPHQRAAVVLHYVADWPVRDVAEEMGCAEATVRVHLHRARAGLTAALQES